MFYCSFYCIALLLITRQWLVKADITNSYCTTPDELPGQCVPYENCTSILEIVLKYGESVPQSEKNYIKATACGKSDNKQHVCCALNSVGLAALSRQECGTYPITKKVSNGRVAPVNFFKWIALLKYRLRQTFKCGGSLISDRYVLTAAHCVSKDKPYAVRLGEHTISQTRDCDQKNCADPIDDVDIEEIIMHPYYRIHQISHDIALLRLSSTVNREPICLPNSEQLMTKLPYGYFVAGWGSTENSDSSDELRYIEIPNRDLDICKTTFRFYNITENHLCVGGTSEKKSSCHGDSGGPISRDALYNYLETRRRRMVQYGVVSTGAVTCGQTSLPAVSTSVPRYMLWITQNIKE